MIKLFCKFKEIVMGNSVSPFSRTDSQYKLDEENWTRETIELLKQAKKRFQGKKINFYAFESYAQFYNLNYILDLEAENARYKQENKQLKRELQKMKRYRLGSSGRAYNSATEINLYGIRRIEQMTYD